MIPSDGNAFEDMLLGMIQGRFTRIHRWWHAVRVTSRRRQIPNFVRSQASKLFLAHFACRNLSQLVSPRFSDEHGNFIVCGPAAVLPNEGLNRLVALTATLAELCEYVSRDAPDLESRIPSLHVALTLDIVPEGANFAGKCIAV